MDFQLQSDQDLIHLYITGDEKGLVELIRRYQTKIYTSIYLLVKDEYLAEDIFQDAFIKVINTLNAGKY
ncbi:MAG TPA: sigma factor, partial [Mucilaginibacter sp.]|nr:sigma factor [Mucilaginibacter sp.]